MPEFIHPNLDVRLHRALSGIMSSSSFSKGAALYREGAEATGFYLVESGSVCVLLTANHCHHVLDTVGEGGILGLPETVPGGVYRATVEAEVPTTAAFVERQAFLSLLAGHPELCMHVIRMLNDNLKGLYREFRLAGAQPPRRYRRSEPSRSIS